MKLLLVEDSADDAFLIRRLLREDSEEHAPQLDVEHVYTIQGALARLAAHSFDVVLLDLNLPGYRGVETIGRIRAEAPQVPIIVLTAHEDTSTIMSAVKAGARDYYVKGRVKAESLREAIRSAAESRGQSQSAG